MRFTACLAAIVFAAFSSLVSAQTSTPRFQWNGSDLEVIKGNSAAKIGQYQGTGPDFNIAVTGAPFGLAISNIAIDSGTLRAWGLIADGASHRLVDVTSVGSLSTAGWTLGQWQEKLPCAQDLTDEIDWVAIQCWANTKYAAGTEMFYPIALPGPISINRPIDVCGHVKFDGFVTAKGSYIKQRGAGQDAIQLCRNGRTANNASIHIRNIRFECATASNCGYMLSANFTTPASTWSRLTSDYVYSSEVQAGAWAGGYYLDGATLSQISHTALTNKATTPWVGSCITGNSTGPFEASDVVLNRVDCSQWQIGLDLHAIGGSSQVEGWRVTQSNFYATSWVKFTSDGGNFNQFIMDGVQGVAYKSIFEADTPSTLSVLGFVFTNSWIGLAPASASTGAYTPAANGVIDWTKVQSGFATNNYFFTALVNTDATVLFGLGPTAGAGYNQIVGNTFASSTGPSTSWIRYFSGAARNVDSRNNYYAGTPVTFQVEANRQVNQSDAYWVSASGGKCHAVVDGTIPTIIESVAECGATVTGMTDAGGSLVVTYPIPIGGGTRVVTPVPVVTSATTGCPTIALSALTTAGFTATFTGCASAASRTLSYKVLAQ